MEFLCILWWVLLGALLGWLLCGLLCRSFQSEDGSVKKLEAENQALRLQLGAIEAPKPIDFAAAKLAGFALKNETDFTIIEGIGPKINQLMINDGIDSFATFSRTSVERLQAILDAAGPRYKLAKPGTWPRQAGLAATNQWSALKKLQDDLDGGVESNDSGANA